MEHYAGIDVSLELSSVCLVDAKGKIVKEAKVASDPDALVAFLRELGVSIERIGLEAGPLSQWLHAGLTKAGFEIVLLETRHVKAALSAMTVKTDRKDARGIAQLIRMDSLVDKQRVAVEDGRDQRLDHGLQRVVGIDFGPVGDRFVAHRHLEQVVQLCRRHPLQIRAVAVVHFLQRVLIDLAGDPVDLLGVQASCALPDLGPPRSLSTSLNRRSASSGSLLPSERLTIFGPPMSSRTSSGTRRRNW